jgi:ArsR family transcriptional regulator
MPLKLTDKEIARIARALAEPRRFQLLREIGACKTPTSCQALRDHHKVTPATMSHHLKELETAGLIETARDGKCMNITLRREVLSAYLGQLAKI